MRIFSTRAFDHILINFFLYDIGNQGNQRVTFTTHPAKCDAKDTTNDVI
jgi:hypothetical protein